MRERSEVADCLELLFQRIKERVHAEPVELLAGQDLSFSQVRVLLLLTKRGEPLAINELAALIGQSVATAGRAVDALVKMDLVERTENPDDRRVKLVSLAPRGRELLDQQMTQHRNAVESFTAGLPEDQVHGLLEALRPIVAGFDPACFPNTQRK